jgi:hypothetical protein
MNCKANRRRFGAASLASLAEYVIKKIEMEKLGLISQNRNRF